MDDEKLKYQIGANIAAYRKQAGLTQVGLAEKLNYSDKAVSKWERGESVPDVLTLPDGVRQAVLGVRLGLLVPLISLTSRNTSASVKNGVITVTILVVAVNMVTESDIKGMVGYCLASPPVTYHIRFWSR